MIKNSFKFIVLIILIFIINACSSNSKSFWGFKPHFSTGTYIDAYAIIENGKINRMGIPKKDIDKMNDIINDKYGIRFIDDEEWRLARVLYEPILQGKVDQATLTSWIKSLDFPIEETEDFYKFSNFRSCLLEVYVQLDQRNSLQDDLKEAIQSFQY